MKISGMKTLKSLSRLIPSLIIGMLIGAVLFWGLSPAKTTVTDDNGGTSLAVQNQKAAGEIADDQGITIQGNSAAQKSKAAPKPQKKDIIWTCSMHPQIRLHKPGLCPICGMKLIPVQNNADSSSETATQPILTVSQNARALMDIETTTVVRKFVSAQIRMVGKVTYDETRIKYITAWVPGRLDRLYVDYTGVPVKKGDHMVYLYSPELLSAQEELIQAVKAVQNMQASNSKMMREITSGTLDAAREKLRLWGLTTKQISDIEKRGIASDHITINSPVSGIVIHKNAQEGMYVKTGTRIYTVADLSKVWVMLSAYESDLVWLRYGQEVQFTAVSYPGEVFKGVISFIDPVLDPVTRTVNVRVDVPNKDGRLKPEMFVKAVVTTRIAKGGKVMDPRLAGKWICPMHPSVIKDEPGKCDICGMPLVRAESLGYVSTNPDNMEKPLVIPVSAALVTGTRAVVYVEVPNKNKPTYEGREVVLGPRAGNYYIVHSGLRVGDKVVTEGNFLIDSALQIQAKPSMMAPSVNSSTDRTTNQTANQTINQINKRNQLLPNGNSISVNQINLAPLSRKQLDGIFRGYFAMQDALARDNFKAASATLKDINNALAAVDMKLLSGKAHHVWMKQLSALKIIMAEASAANNIEKLREVFSLLSNQMLVLTQQFGTPEKSPIYQLKCTMAFNNRGAIWLQQDKNVNNPYLGTTMLKCGDIIEVIQPGSEEIKPSNDKNTGDQQHD